MKSYERVKPSIVCFTCMFEKGSAEDKLFPPILGTGFVVREDGLIATNRHVVDAFSKVYRPPGFPLNKPAVRALIFCQSPQGMYEVPLKVLGAVGIVSYTPGQYYYGSPQGPDISLVRVDMKGLPTVTLSEATNLLEGMEIATAGFPMGRDALTAPGWLQQLSPTLQSGIISSVLPFPCPTAHAFTINVMTQGGASGSPVFDTESGNVLGVLYAGLSDIDKTINIQEPLYIPTSISYVVPSRYLRSMLVGAKKQIDAVPLPNGAEDLDTFISTNVAQDPTKVGRGTTIKIEPRDRDVAP